jgi:hypothetical protein
MSKHEPAKRPRQESDGEGCEHCNRGGELIEFRKEQLIEHQRRDQPINEKVVPFDRGAYGASRQDAPRVSIEAEIGGCPIFGFLEGSVSTTESSN